MKSIAFVIPLLALAACNKASNVAKPTGPIVAVSAPAGTTWEATVAETADGGYRMGNPNAPIKLVEYGSRTCPHCAKFSAESAAGLKTYVATGKVSFEFRDFPIHAPDLAAIMLGRCGGPGPYFTILEQMMAAQSTMLPKIEKLPPEMQSKLASMSPNEQAAQWADLVGYRDFVQQRGITADAAKTCLADSGAVDRIGKQLAAADAQYKISGTPTFILNGEVLANVNEWPAVESALKAAGA